MINIFWITYTRTVIAIALFLKVYWTDDCSGLSAKSQLLYGIVLSIRSFVFLIEYNIQYRLTEIAIVETICIVVTLCTALLMMYPLKKTYEDKYDTARIDVLIIPCIVLAVLVNYKLILVEILWSFSIFLEALAIIPQCQFTKNAGRLHVFVVIYIVAMLVHDVLFTTYWIRHNHFCFYFNIRLATLTLQVLVYCYYFLWILPRLITCKTENQEKSTDVEVLVEKGKQISSIRLPVDEKSISVIVLDNNESGYLKAEEGNVKY